ncbi:tetratricopeptide repeat protein [Pleionea sp. CnH1-48]|uniref:tetratricopeptide repeat protein n=1 Tax=Pleionea sp. CnH1-48 TaxID=2954494 RepID=UPI0020977572|nr:tetratricopeptide repeat protein [Pleionea sp. CnH1-48]MCO7224246.1 tetratricopeptide repeat protein [Pleionea sp. CnH1-48]
MYKILLVIILSFSALSSSAENKASSANTKAIATYDEELSKLSGRKLIVKIKDITTKTRINKPDVALHYFNRALKILEETPDAKLKSLLYGNAAWAYMVKGNLDKGVEFANIALEAAQSVNDYYRMSVAETALGGAYYYKGEIGVALSHYKRSLSYAKKANNIKNVATGLHNLSSIYGSIGDNDLALEYLLKARETNVEAKQHEQLIGNDLNISEIYANQKNFESSERYLKSALAMAIQIDDQWQIAKANSMLGLAYIRQKQFEKAQPHVTKAREIFEANGDKVQIVEAIRSQGLIYSHFEKYDLAAAEFNKALALAKAAKSNLTTRAVTINLANLYIKMADYDRAMEFAQSALKISRSTNNKLDESTAEKIIARIYDEQNQFKESVEHYKRYDGLSKEIREKNISDTNERMERRFQTAQQEKQIELLTKDNELKKALVDRKTYERNAWIAGLALLVFIAFFFVYRQTQRRRLENERAEMMAELVERKNQLLADVSHELRTPLTVLQLKVEALQHNLVKDVNASYDSLMTKIGDINKLISDIYALAQSDIGALELNRATNDCEQYLQEWADELCDAVEAKGFQWQQNIELPTNTNVSFDENKIKQVISNLVDNSMAYTDLPGTIALSSAINEQSWQIVIEDSAPGVKDEDLPRIFERLFRVESSRSRATGGSGLGLSICKSIIEAHEGSITSSASQLGGLAIKINLPLKS